MSQRFSLVATAATTVYGSQVYMWRWWPSPKSWFSGSKCFFNCRVFRLRLEIACGLMNKTGLKTNHNAEVCLHKVRWTFHSCVIRFRGQSEVLTTYSDERKSTSYYRDYSYKLRVATYSSRWQRHVECQFSSLDARAAQQAIKTQGQHQGQNAQRQQRQHRWAQDTCMWGMSR